MPDHFNLEQAWENFGYCKLRLLPKEQGFRPIMNLRQHILRGQDGGKASNNGMLRNIHAVLDYYRTREEEKMGASVICMSKVYERLLGYKQSLKKQGSLQKRLFFAKFDIKSCYDSIPHEKLLKVIDDLIDKEDFIIQRCDQISLINGAIKRRFTRMAFPSNDIHISDPLSGSLIVDKVVGYRIERKKILNMIKEHVTRNIVKVNGRFYQQWVGVPQGFHLSTLLCSFFYADLDQKCLHYFRNDPSSLLMRFIDDLLFITTDRHLMDRFIERIRHGFPEYGITFNLDKAATNFNHPLFSNTNNNVNNKFSWCGMLIDEQALCVTADYGKLFGVHIGDTLTIDYGAPVVDTFEKYLQMYEH